MRCAASAGFAHRRITLRSLGAGGYFHGGTTSFARGAPFSSTVPPCFEKGRTFLHQRRRDSMIRQVIENLRNGIDRPNPVVWRLPERMDRREIYGQAGGYALSDFKIVWRQHRGVEKSECIGGRFDQPKTGPYHSTPGKKKGDEAAGPFRVPPLRNSPRRRLNELREKWIPMLYSGETAFPLFQRKRVFR